MQGYNFTERVRKVLRMAREEASRLHHQYVGTEHLLLGLLHEGEGVATAVLELLGASADRVRQMIEETIQQGDSTAPAGSDLPYTSRAKKTLELAMLESHELRHPYIGTEHLLLGLLREEKGIAAQVLHALGVTLEPARAEVVRLLGQPGENVLVATAAPPVTGIQMEMRYADGSVVRGEFTSVPAAMMFLGRHQN